VLTNRKPKVIVSHHLSLEEAARGCELFDKKQDDCHKVVLAPGTAPATAAGAANGLASTAPGGSGTPEHKTPPPFV
jgi:hypothetical protein